MNDTTTANDCQLTQHQGVEAQFISQDSTGGELKQLDSIAPSEAWEEYSEYLDRLDEGREYAPASSPRWTAWLEWLRTPAVLRDDDADSFPF